MNARTKRRAALKSRTVLKSKTPTLPRRSLRIKQRPVAHLNGTQIKTALKDIKATITSKGKPHVAAQVEKTVLAIMAATKAASATRWVRGAPTKAGSHGRLYSVSQARAPKRKFGVLGDAPAAKKSKTESGSVPRPAGSVNASVAATVDSADKQLSAALVSKVEALMDAALIHKSKVEYGNNLEVRLSQIDEHGLGLYIMNDINDNGKICKYGNFLITEQIPKDAPYTAVPFGQVNIYIDPASEEDDVGHYAYPCEHIPESVCNARIVIDEDKMEIYVVATRYILGGSEIFLQWPRKGAGHFSKAMEEKLSELAAIESRYNKEVARWEPSDRGFLPIQYVENLINHLLRYSKTPKNPHMYINNYVLPIMLENSRESKKLSEDQRYINIYDRLVADPKEKRPDQLPRRDGGTVIIIGGPGHFAVWKFIYKGNDTWDSYVLDSLYAGSEATRKIAHALDLFREDVKKYNMTINKPKVINLGWQGKEKWSNNACGVFAAYVAYMLMISDVEEVKLKGKNAPNAKVIVNLMKLVSRIMAKEINRLYKEAGITPELESEMKLFG